MLNRSKGRQGCRSCGGSGWSRSSSGRCDCAKVHAAPAPRATGRPVLRNCEDCHQPTEHRLCDACDREAIERADVAFNARVRASGERRRAETQAARPVRKIAPAAARPAAVVHRDVKPSKVIEAPPADAPETRVVYVDEQRPDPRDAAGEARVVYDGEDRYTAWGELRAEHEAAA